MNPRPLRRISVSPKKNSPRSLAISKAWQWRCQMRLTAPDGITEAMRMKPGMAMGSNLLGKRAGGAADSDPSKIPAEHVFHLMLQNCTNCHAKFREKRQ
ncbi:hypothetical protein [Mesorhizobium sp.]|uniref:hypothetical protein n=1 Tax=Mesorhizobium sp. TaxID=1871066 RepID=UPI0025E2440E|nr:hypothetical protein [Mesorhizobium sp.]